MSCLADLEAGEEPVSLNAARHDPRLRVDGRSHDLSWIHRAVTRGCRGASGQRVRLEAIVLSGKSVTTRSAIGRFIATQAGAAASPVRPAQHHHQDKAHAAAKKRLAAAGI